jgi:hypothetical protein
MGAGLVAWAQARNPRTAIMAILGVIIVRPALARIPHPSE